MRFRSLELLEGKELPGITALSVSDAFHEMVLVRHALILVISIKSK
jgi:hypothetical protein